MKAGGVYEVIKGLKEGEEVVTRANFLIDSESKVQAAVATWEDNSEITDKDEEETKEMKVIETEPFMDNSPEFLPDEGMGMDHKHNH